MLCDIGSGLDCRERECVYSIVCKDCKDAGNRKEYRGQTSRSIGERIDEHFKKWASGDETNNPLFRHGTADHNGGKFDVEVKLKASCYGKPSRRLITEAVMIEELGDAHAMNSKDEWKYVDLRKLGLL